MNLFSAILTAVIMLLDPSEAVFVPSASAARGDAASSALGEAARRGDGKMTINSRRCDFDRASGVIMFEGDAVARSGRDYSLHAERVFAFLQGTNDVERIVAVGNVAVTNGLRSGSCAKAVYLRGTGEIEMYSGGGITARLKDPGSGELSGKKIKFWIGAEHVEVERSRITVENDSKGEIIP